MEASSADKFADAFKEALKEHSTAVVVIGSPLVGSNLKPIIDLLTKNRLPAIYTRGSFVDRGGLRWFDVTSLSVTGAALYLWIRF
jgi:putative ABC transport system substrate-binding protein